MEPHHTIPKTDKANNMQLKNAFNGGVNWPSRLGETRELIHMVYQLNIAQQQDIISYTRSVSDAKGSLGVCIRNPPRGNLMEGLDPDLMAQIFGLTRNQLLETLQNSQRRIHFTVMRH